MMMMIKRGVHRTRAVVSASVAIMQPFCEKIVRQEMEKGGREWEVIAREAEMRVKRKENWRVEKRRKDEKSGEKERDRRWNKICVSN